MKPSVALTLLVVGFLGCCQVIHGAPYTFTTIDAPYQGVFQTYANGINDGGEIVGLFYEASTGLNGHAFLLQNGSFSAYFLSPSGTEFDGINNQGAVVGLSAGGILFQNGQVSTISVPGAEQTSPRGINNSGQIVGTADVSSGLESFLLSGGNYSVFNVGGSADGINDVGQIVGTQSTHGYLLSNGISSLIDFPGASGTSLDGINDQGTIVGFYFPAGTQMTQGLILNQQGFQTFGFPGSIATELLGINDQDDIVGNYTDTNGVVHGFLAVPMAEASIPEPAPLLLLTSGLAGFLILIVRRRMIRTSTY
jgi:hypothetical protein